MVGEERHSQERDLHFLILGIDVVVDEERHGQVLDLHLLILGVGVSWKNFPMTAGCCTGGSIYGLVSGHAYTFLDI